MKKILISSFDMEVGGVERSLVSMLNNFDYENYSVDLMLYKHQGDFMNLIVKDVNLLTENPFYSTFRKSISNTIKDKQYTIGMTRLLSKAHAEFIGNIKKSSEPGYFQMQLMWKYALPFLPKLDKEYDTAISFLWPHYFIAKKVKAKNKIAWIHTDYSNVETNIKMDLKMWKMFDHIIAVSDACKQSFLVKYPTLKERVKVIENITSPDFIKKMAEENVENPLLNDRRFKIITVARLSHAKGIDLAIKAMKILKGRGINKIAWYVVGYGGDEQLIQELIIKNGLEDCFVLLGKKTNPYPFIKAADLYIQPSRYEGKAVTVTEAKILGKPILITNYSTAHSQINSGLDGEITDLSIDGLVEGIRSLYTNEKLRIKLINNCKKEDYKNSEELYKLYSLF
ncbi:glycosyltransferase [Peribacillus sp. NPDC097284]|uniref:glycosyltransferase n=1 Tax=Peribacillus sp. NPDC097284 TaxID=3364401 RepID=UPI00382A0AEF